MWPFPDASHLVRCLSSFPACAGPLPVLVPCLSWAVIFTAGRYSRRISTKVERVRPLRRPIQNAVTAIRSTAPTAA